MSPSRCLTPGQARIIHQLPGAPWGEGIQDIISLLGHCRICPPLLADPCIELPSQEDQGRCEQSGQARTCLADHIHSALQYPPSPLNQCVCVCVTLGQGVYVAGALPPGLLHCHCGSRKVLRSRAQAVGSRRWVDSQG